MLNLVGNYVAFINRVRLEWTLFTAATTTNNQTRDALISGVRSRAGNNRTLGVFPASYDAQTGASFGGEASSSLGGLFAPMSLQYVSKKKTK